MTVMVSLIGEQTIPNLLVLRRERPEKAVLVFTDRTKAVAERLRKLLEKEKETKPYLLSTAPYDMQTIYGDLKGYIEKNDWDKYALVFNLTGGTKPMVLATYQIAIMCQSPYVYLQSEGKRSRLYRYEFDSGAYRLAREEIMGELISINDHLQAHLGQLPQMRERPRDKFGQAFEDAIAAALREFNLEIKVGVHLAGALEVDLVVRRENQIGVIQAKTGGAALRKIGLDQLNAACEQRYLGTYTAKMLIINKVWGKTRSNLRELATAWRTTVVELPSFTETSPFFSIEEKQRLQDVVLKGLGG